MAASIIFLIGPAASGKSSVGKLLAQHYKMTYIDKDVACNTMTGQLLVENGHQASDRDGCDYYKEVVMPLEYETILNIADANAKIGQSVILDAPFGAYFEDPDYIIKLRHKYGWNATVHTIVLQIHIHEDELKRRMQARNYERDQWKFAHWDTYIASLSKSRCQWCGIPLKSYDNTNPLPSHEDLANILALDEYIQ